MKLSKKIIGIILFIVLLLAGLLLLHFMLYLCLIDFALANLALHPSGVAKSSTSFGWGLG